MVSFALYDTPTGPSYTSNLWVDCDDDPILWTDYSFQYLDSENDELPLFPHHLHLPDRLAGVPQPRLRGIRERISSTGDATRGIGLYGVADDMRKTGRQLIIHSGLGMLETSEEVESESRRTTLFPGTLVYVSIPS